MSDRDRRGFRTAVAALFAAILLCLFVLWIFQTGASTAISRYEKERHAGNYAAQAEQEIRDRCLLLDPSRSAECIREIIQATHEHERAESDLVAQSDMALWAFWMTIVSAGALTATGLGVYWVRETLVETRKAVKAADDAVAVTRDIGKRQLRAYITVIAESIAISPGQVKVNLFGKNTGQTPALNVRTWSVVAIDSPPFDEDWLNDSEYPSSVSDVGANGDIRMYAYGPHEITPGLADALRAGILGCWVYGTVWYEDFFGEGRITRFRFALSVDNENFVLMPADTGNEMT
jgi:HAMP domain-containing protein